MTRLSLSTQHWSVTAIMVIVSQGKLPTLEVAVHLMGKSPRKPQTAIKSTSKHAGHVGEKREGTSADLCMCNW